MSGGDLIADLTTLKANTLTLGADIGVLKYDSGESAYLTAVSAALTEAQNVSDVIKDVGTEASASPAFQALSKYSGIANLGTSGTAVYLDISELYSEAHDGAIKSSTVITTLGDAISFTTNLVRVGAEATAVAATFPEDAAIAGMAATAESIGFAAGSLTGSALTAIGSIMNYTEKRDGATGEQIITTQSGANYSYDNSDQNFNITGNGVTSGSIIYDPNGTEKSGDIASNNDQSDSNLPSVQTDDSQSGDGSRVKETSATPSGAQFCIDLLDNNGNPISGESCAAGWNKEITSDRTSLSDGQSIDTTHNYDANGNEVSYDETIYNSDGSQAGDASFNASGGYISGSAGNGEFANDGQFGDGGEDGAYDGDGGGSGGSGGYGGYGGYDGGYQFTRAAKLKGVDIGAIAKLDQATLHAPGAATAADHARAQASALVTSHNTAAQFEGAKWALPQSGAKVVTWSLATLVGPKAAPFSSYMGSRYTAEVEKAFAAWGAATGITFKEVADGATTDIRLGFGDFDTATSGVAGYTSFRDKNGAIQAGAVVRVEDPSQDPLVHSASGGLKYSKSGISLQQLLEHEIGHALGFADNADPNSVMNYTGSTTAHGLDAQDKQAARTLYQGAAANDVHMTNYPTGGSASLAQALAAFAPAAGSLSSLDHETSQSQSMQLAVNRHLPIAA